MIEVAVCIILFISQSAFIIRSKQKCLGGVIQAIWICMVALKVLLAHPMIYSMSHSSQCIHGLLIFVHVKAALIVLNGFVSISEMISFLLHLQFTVICSCLFVMSCHSLFVQHRYVLSLLLAYLLRFSTDASAAAFGAASTASVAVAATFAAAAALTAAASALFHYRLCDFCSCWSCCCCCCYCCCCCCYCCCCCCCCCCDCCCCCRCF